MPGAKKEMGIYILCFVAFVTVCFLIDWRAGIGFIAVVLLLIVLNRVFGPGPEKGPNWCETGNCCRDMDGNWGPCFRD